MLSKLSRIFRPRRRLCSNQRLLLIALCVLLVYLLLNSREFYAKTDRRSVESDHPLRGFLVKFISNLEYRDLVDDQNVLDPTYSTRFFVKNLKSNGDQNARPRDLNAFLLDHLISSPNDYVDFKLARQGVSDLRALNLATLGADSFNMIKENLHRFSTTDLLSFVIKVKNHQQLLTNLDRFELNDFKIVIVVQVHSRIFYLKLLIESLSNVRGIENVLLIFSHDVFDLKINRLIEEIRFTKVLQIFLPYSLQLYPNSFPGQSPNDCARDIPYYLAKIINCNNADYPDKYGHYREAHFCQTKHHWWWKINYIFNKLNLTRRFDGLLLTLEDDHYVLPDLLYMLKLVHAENRKKNRVELITMGAAYVKDLRQLTDYSGYAVNRQWHSSKHNTGMAMTRALFNGQIKKCAKEFCERDEYNWDWSLNYISRTCLPEPLRTTNFLFPRVLHIGECGLHIHKSNCEDMTLINNVNTLIKSVDILFPKTLKIKTLDSERAGSTKSSDLIFGGWADRRDHELCMNFTV